MKAFKSWTMADVEAHNARVSGGKAVCSEGSHRPSVPAPVGSGTTHRPAPQGKTLVEVFAAEAGIRIRQSKKPLMNKLEEQFLQVILADGWPPQLVLKQAMRFRLGNGIWYKPDFVCIAPVLKIYEVKGPHAFRGGFENLKVAAAMYPQMQWVLAWKESGNWKQQVVLA